MEKSDPALLRLRDPLIALALLTRLPVPASDGTRQSEAAWAYPIAGLVVGAIAALVGGIAAGLGLPSAVCALLALTMLIVTTGAMHEDGLADTADGLWGGWDRSARLEIMRDSRIGTYGVLSLCLSVAARWVALWLLYDASTGAATAALIAVAALSRSAMPVLMAALPHARGDGLSHRVGRVSGTACAIAAAVSGIVGVILLGSAIIPAVFWGAAVVAGLAFIAKRKIGGQTGDILGASQQLAEITILFSLLT